MQSLKFVATEGELSPEDFKVLSEDLLSHHASKGHPRKSYPYSIFLKGEHNKIFGGIIVSFLWKGMYIRSLWVEESIRERGRGQKLMKAAETEALKRSCTIAYTDTFSWQAPGFYEKLGYVLYGKLDNFPEGSSLSFYYKDLR